MDATSFVKAVKATAKRHPQLRSVIDKNAMSFVELDGFVPGEEHYEVVDARSEDEWMAIADAESHLDADIYGPMPLWKIILVRYASVGNDSNTLLVKFHHCIGDGSSGYIITHDIMRFHQRLEQEGELGDVQPLPQLASPDKMAFPVGVGAEEQVAADRLLEDFTKRRCEWSPSVGLPFDRTVDGDRNSTLYRDGSLESTEYHFHYFDVNRRFDAVCEAIPAFQENIQRNDGLVQDMNFSSFGKYFYDPSYGHLTIDKMYATGAGWCPTFGSCVFLILGLTRNHYSFVYSTSSENERVARNFFDKAVDIIETAHSLDDSYCLLDWVSAGQGSRGGA